MCVFVSEERCLNFYNSVKDRTFNRTTVLNSRKVFIRVKYENSSKANEDSSVVVRK